MRHLKVPVLADEIHHVQKLRRSGKALRLAGSLLAVSIHGASRVGEEDVKTALVDAVDRHAVYLLPVIPQRVFDDDGAAVDRYIEVSRQRLAREEVRPAVQQPEQIARDDRKLTVGVSLIEAFEHLVWHGEPGGRIKIIECYGKRKRRLRLVLHRSGGGDRNFLDLAVFHAHLGRQLLAVWELAARCGQ